MVSGIRFEEHENKMVNPYSGPAAKLLTPPTLILVKMTVMSYITIHRIHFFSFYHHLLHPLILLVPVPPKGLTFFPVIYSTH